MILADRNKNRITWVDLIKGFGIVLVVYGHNFPFLERYIYNFHMPLFFFLSGLFHPNEITFLKIKNRAKKILIPYFFWSSFLFLFWFAIGRNFGDSAQENYSVLNNFIGIFYAQGGHFYMNWGPPMWFLPAIFLLFLIFGLIRKYIAEKYQHLFILILIAIGFIMPKVANTNFIWSLDVVFVGLSFYAIAFYFKSFFFSNLLKKQIYLLILGACHIACSLIIFNKVDMYRSNYGNLFLFLLNAFTAIFFWISLFKNIKTFKILSFLGKNTLLILALHLRSITFIKAILLVIFNITLFNFTEIEKVVLTLIQLIILYPLIKLINRKTPYLNGK